MRNIEEEKAFIETINYLYKNPITSFLYKLGHMIMYGLESKKGNIIDLGCGTGEHFPYLKGRDFIGVDIDENLLRQARNKYPNSVVQKQDIYRLSFNDGSFDTAVANAILEHLDDLPKAISEIKRILKPNGELIVLIPIENFIYKLGRMLTVKRYIEKKCNIDYDDLIRKEHVNSFKDVMKELKKNFKIKRKVGVPFFLPLFFLNVFMVVKCRKFT